MAQAAVPARYCDLHDQASNSVNPKSQRESFHVPNQSDSDQAEKAEAFMLAMHSMDDVVEAVEAMRSARSGS